jgi:hypothetical protein
MARTSSTTQARQVARKRLAEKIEVRRRREQAELERITDFEAAQTRRAQAETEMAAAVAGLIALGNTVADTADLTDQTEAEIRRLRKLATARANTGPKTAPEPDMTQHPERHPVSSSTRPGHAEDGQNALTFDTTTPADSAPEAT